MWNHNQDNILRIKIKRGEKIISIGVNKTKSTSSLNLTKLWEDNYESVIPYYNLNGIIITWLTHELIDILISHNYIPSNYIIDSLFEGDIDKLKDTLIIIDCLDDGVRYKYDLPTIKKKCLKNGNLNCYVVKKIKNICAQSISKLEDIDNLKTTNCKIKLQINNSIHKVIYA
nr:hypothetical protein mv_R532 [Moumouvirus Monve]